MALPRTRFAKSQPKPACVPAAHTLHTVISDAADYPYCAFIHVVIRHLAMRRRHSIAFQAAFVAYLKAA
ncbi:MAG: hypothetical protein D8B42_05700 [Kingella sp. (in: b-proteobacteria)]|nr:MAG: hypothetical protein D8B42_05700 [Kingella sp. (in: b-proteobacteria)]